MVLKILDALDPGYTEESNQVAFACKVKSETTASIAGTSSIETGSSEGSTANL